MPRTVSVWLGVGLLLAISAASAACGRSEASGQTAADLAAASTSPSEAGPPDHEAPESPDVSGLPVLETSAADQAEMVLVPAGEFVMGRDDGFADERPQRTESLPAFYIYRHEVTLAQYARFLLSSQGRGHAPDPAYGDRMPADYFSNPKYARHPVVNVDWEDAQAYCAWAGHRLPREEEWEKAARGTDGRTFPWGNAFGADRCNWEESPGFEGAPHFTYPVGSFPQGVSPFGALDMAGNAWEWVDAWYSPYAGNNNRDPLYNKRLRVIRGGAWLRYPLGVSATARDFSDPDYGYHSIGFRCASSPQGGRP